MNKLSFFTFVLSFISLVSLSAQSFIEPASGYSTKKIAYITLADGTKMEGSFKGGQESLNGGYKWVSFKPTDGKKMKYQAAEVKSMLIPQSKMSKFNEATSMIGDATKWDEDVTINKEAVKEGYYYYETTIIAKKKKEITAVRQILNPGYSDKVKILDNKIGASGASTSIGGIKVAGGKDRSYFIIVGEGKATKVSAKKYDEQFSELFAACPEFVEKYKEDPKWSDFEKHVFEYSQSCNE